jgi:hypothetical protein
MLESLSIPRYSPATAVTTRRVQVISRKGHVMSLNPWWVTGFVDGEGCFTIQINRSKGNPEKGRKPYTQVQLIFAVTQGAKSLFTLELLQQFFQGKGTIQANPRKDNHKEPLYIYRIRGMDDIGQLVIPHFTQYPLQTAKRNDFAVFSQAFQMMQAQQHLSESGIQTFEQMRLQLRNPTDLGVEVESGD